ncbi:hypothetical protein A3E39_03935 [Candidatus Uhrbacteria bacterium RIFCSPHIGHO2_12_FULL_60_25]|uniref:RNA polymerase alpha subunit C-terminal domain-containing protein n=1 Tax=Candidatus Uhrbacteria bacterium RIFCSPHIGHO2_12_FULL_60_25 TaxID=1802399 RepID=A0A1F7UME3_9BACT|nr:MAG: hypothetical protein A3D73_03870 [Candidatus Uhrbacteria bacterium RIFCSPHIGHO2_02_FULL_60_44]OGL79432.1 MAG: hypothetical protein A3E39_03935 [Candidatus Uhrbacteria bacterium RIFCSPHIGHO2_12_FULL_60_25]
MDDASKAGIPHDILLMSRDELLLSVRVYNSLEDFAIDSVAELVSQTEADLLKGSGFGNKSLEEVKTVLRSLHPDLRLGMTLPEEICRKMWPRESGLPSDLQRHGIVIQGGHFVYASGRHGSTYINKDAIYARPWLVEGFARQIAKSLRWRARSVKVVAASAPTGAILASWVTDQLMRRRQGREFFSVYAEKVGEALEFRRGYDALIRGAQVLILDDVMTTGMTVEKLVNAVEASDGMVAAIAILISRGDANRSFCIKRFGPDRCTIFPYTLHHVPMKSWDHDDCQLCRDHVPINMDVRKGREYLAKKGSGS